MAVDPGVESSGAAVSALATERLLQQPAALSAPGKAAEDAHGRRGGGLWGQNWSYEPVVEEEPAVMTQGRYLRNRVVQ